ncbi:hypothetical protein FRC96_07805 [Lujinxingia vulgaris]|uniref:Uncharacterized protein n=1 Tax=Lujinxingia vulgaris TaxID=2600176 RepID=A0A5C6X819_9DELT|nr:hypothetical protein [Lujinxingia vulgaris]TXD38012.1 hypothetical protein FRC96_07805 [Lujinxingia vulgaris]
MSDNVYITQEELEARAEELLLITEATKALSQSSNELERTAVHTAAATAALTPPLEHLQANSESGARAAEAQAEGVKNVGDEAGGAADEVKDLDKANKGFVEAWEGYKKTLGVVGDIYNLTAGTMKTLVSEQLEQLAVDALLRSSLESTGAKAEEVAQRMSQANVLFANAQSRTVFGDEAQAAALTNLINITGNAESAYASLGTVLDAAQHSGSDLEKVSVAIGQAMTGDIKKLKEMNLLRKEEAEKLTQVEDSALRASLAMNIVRERTLGAAESVDPMVQRLSQLQNDFGDVRQAVGGFILSSAEATLQLMGFGDQSDGTGSALSRLAGDINEAVEALGVFSEKRAGLMGEVKDTTWSEDWHKATTELRESMDWHDWINPVSSFKALWTLPQDTLVNHILGQNGTMGMEQFNAELEKIVERRKAIMRDPPPEILIYGPEAPSVDDRLKQQAEQRQQEAAEREADRQDALARQRRERAAEERKQSEQRIALMNLELEALQATTDEERESIELKRSIAEIKHRGLSDAEETLAIEVATTQMDAQREKRKKEAEEEAKTKQYAIDLANQELKILNTRDELQRASAERELALMRVAQQDMSDEERRLEYARIEIGYEETLAEIKDSERKKADEERAKAEEERKKARKALQEHFKYADKLGGSLAGAFDALGVSGIGETVDALSGMSDEFFTLRDAGKKSAVALEGSLTAGSAAAKGAMEALGLGVQETAGIQAAFEAAAAVAAGATGNIPGAIAHGVAATMYGAVAAGAGSGGGSSAGSSSSALTGGGSSSGGPIHTPDPQQLKEYQTQAYLEALREYDREGQQIVINVNNQGANFFERQTASTQRVASELERAAQLTIGGSALRG